MCCKNCCKIFSVLFLTIALCTYRSCCCISIHRCSWRTLCSCIHISTIVITHICIICSTFHCTWQWLNTNIICTTITAKYNKLIIFFKLAFTLHSLVSPFNTCHCWAGIFKCTMNITVFPCNVWILERWNIKTSCCTTNNSLVSFVKSTKHVSCTNCCSTTCTHSMTWSKSFRFIHYFFKIIAHYFASLSLNPI